MKYYKITSLYYEFHFIFRVELSVFSEKEREREREYMSDGRSHMASSSPSDLDHITTPSPDGRQSTARDRRRKTRHRSPDTDHTRKSQKTIEMSHECIGKPAPDNPGSAGPSITCEHLRSNHN